VFHREQAVSNSIKILSAGSHKQPERVGPYDGAVDKGGVNPLHSYNRGQNQVPGLDSKDNSPRLCPGCRNRRQQDNRDRIIPPSSTQEEVRPVFWAYVF